MRTRRKQRRGIDSQNYAMCEHHDFQADVTVVRVVRATDTVFMAHIQLRCRACRTRFAFVGLPAGASFREPMVSPTNLELRAPIEPEGHLTSLLGGDPATAFPVR